MAPVCADPRQIVITFNPARRRALLKLVDDVTRRMLAQLDNAPNDLGPVELEQPSSGANSGSSTGREQQPPSRPQDGKSPEPTARGLGRPSKEAERIQLAAIKHMNEWRNEFMPRLEEIVRVEDDDKIRNERKKRAEELEKIDKPDNASHRVEDLIDLGEGKVEKSEDFFSLQLLYEPTETRLTTVPEQDRKEALSCILLLLLSTGKYSAHSRTLALYLASSLELSQSFVIQEEIEIAKSLMESSTADDGEKEAMNAEAEAAKRQQENKFSRFWKVGLASIAGATIIGVTGGLAAPLVAGALGGILGGVGLGGVASFLGIFWMNGALVGALFGAYGAKMTGEMMDKYAREVEDFKFIPLNEDSADDAPTEESAKQQDRRLRVTIGINGWLTSEDDVTKPWRALSTETEVFALRYEMKTLLTLGTAFENLARSAAWNVFKSEVIKRTALATLWAALWPIQVLTAASNVDNPFSHASNRSRKAGQLLADALINKVQGERPVTLIGFSNGATAIHACLQSLADRRAFGLVDTVVIMGAPAPAASGHWRTLHTAVSGKIFNVFSENDMILSFVYRMHTLSLGVAGLQAIKDVSNLENLDLSEVVSGHLRYPELMGEILRKCAFIGVKGGTEIEEDDVIRMKHDYDEGDMGRLNSSKSENESSPALPQRPSKNDDPESPAPPRRPDQSDTKPASIPRRPVGASNGAFSSTRKPVYNTSDDSDDERHGGIVMMDNDSD